MKTKIFISYIIDDYKKMKMLSEMIDKTDTLKSIVIPANREGLILLIDKVIKGITECDIMVPILTRNSITSQWVNQEIGYALALKAYEKVIPVVEHDIFDNLNGFIHKQYNLSYNYPGNQSNKGIENKYFKKCITTLVDDIVASRGKKGVLFKLHGGKKLYLLVKDKLRRMPDRPTRVLLGYTSAEFKDISQSEFDNYPADRPLPSIKNADIIEYNNALYIVLENTVRHIPKPDTLKYIQQWNTKTSILVSKSEFDKYKLESPLKSVHDIERQ
jgi:hypothetical protein